MMPVERDATLDERLDESLDERRDESLDERVDETTLNGSWRRWGRER